MPHAVRARACAGTQYAIDVCFLVDIVLQFRTTLLGLVTGRDYYMAEARASVNEQLQRDKG